MFECLLLATPADLSMEALSNPDKPTAAWKRTTVSRRITITDHGGRSRPRITVGPGSSSGLTLSPGMLLFRAEPGREAMVVQAAAGGPGCQRSVGGSLGGGGGDSARSSVTALTPTHSRRTLHERCTVRWLEFNGIHCMT